MMKYGLNCLSAPTLPRGRLARATVAAVVCLSTAGCITKRHDDNATIYAYEWWTWTLCLVLAAGAVWLGWKMRSGWRGWLVMIAGFFLGMGVAPDLAVETLTVDVDHFDLKRGAWFDSYNLRFDDIATIDLTSKERWSRRGKRTDYNLDCTLRNGEVVTVPVGDLLKKGLAQVLDYAARKNVVVTDRTSR